MLLKPRAYFSALIGGTMHVDVKIARLKALVLRIGQLGSRWCGPGVIGSFGQRYDHRTIFGSAHGVAGSAVVNVRSGSFNSCRGNTAAHTFVCGNDKRAPLWGSRSAPEVPIGVLAAPQRAR